MREADSRRMLGQLRRREGLTQSAMAQRLGVAQSQISQIERGDRRLSRELMETAMTVFDLPHGYFSQTPVAYDRLSLNFRRRALPAKVQDRVVVTFGEIEQQLQSTDLRIPTVDIRQNRRDERLPVSDIETAAAKVRQVMGLGSGPVGNVIRAVESAGIIVAPVNPDLAPQGKFDGVSSPEMVDGRPPVIAFLPQEAGDRQRFTVAHELGHLVLHLVHRPEVEDVREKEANDFAGAFLYPAEAAQQDITPSLGLQGYKKIKQRWGISIQALLMRARTLGVIDDARYLNLRQQVSHRGWNKVEPVSVGTERTQLVEMIRDNELRKKVIPLRGVRG